MNGLRETCWCGHDKATHFVDAAEAPPVVRTCLASGCDCRKYANEFNDPKPVPVRTRPRHIATCQCSRCKEFDVQSEHVSTIPPSFI